jgi:hypothetical protein
MLDAFTGASHDNPPKLAFSPNANSSLRWISPTAELLKNKMAKDEMTSKT